LVLNKDDVLVDLDGEIVNYTWYFGDKTVGYGKRVDHTYLQTGEYEVILTVTDDDGAKNKQTTYASAYLP